MVKAAIKSEWSRLLDLMDREVEAYQALLEQLKQEQTCLRRNDTDGMLSLLQAKQGCVAEIGTIRNALRQEVAERTGRRDVSLPLESVVPQMPLPESRKAKACQHAVDLLKRQIVQFNGQNKRFVQEALDYIGDLLSLLTASVREEPLYMRQGRTLPAPPLAARLSMKV
jgi:flagellar biosynthesis/type III secretory pathway chaperone